MQFSLGLLAGIGSVALCIVSCADDAQQADEGGELRALQENLARATGEIDRAISVAVFDFDGAELAETTNLRLRRILDSQHGFDCQIIDSDQIRTGALETVDVVVFPGGSGRRQALALGRQGREAVISFVRNGGGFVGICGGAFLATAGYDWSLGIINAKTVTGDLIDSEGRSTSLAAR